MATLEFLDDISRSRSLHIRGEQNEIGLLDYIKYLGIDMILEPELVWIAREMCCAPLPPNAVKLVSKSGLVFFHDRDIDVFTVEHPLTQRFLKVLEIQRVDAIALRKRPAIAALQTSESDIGLITEFPHTQLPCSDCGLHQSEVFCNECVAVYCKTCHELLHNSGIRKSHTTKPTPASTPCSSCPSLPPQVFCDDCKDYFCLNCFESLHKRGKRCEHSALIIHTSVGNILPQTVAGCIECKERNACIRCDFCKDSFCLTCYWRCHLNGNRRRHTASLVTVQPLCNQCNSTRATLLCEQCQELFCSNCFGHCHLKGQRKLHLFSDAMNVLLLLERLDPVFHKYIKEERATIMKAIVKVQAYFRGHCQRRYFQRRRELATVIQKRWRGGQTRKNLIGVLDQFNWRKRQITSQLMRSNNMERLDAVQAKLDVANKQQEKLAGKLDAAKMTTALDLPVMQVMEQKTTLSPTADLRNRITKNIRESDKLRKLLNLND